jgi:hypothetical protein
MEIIAGMSGLAAATAPAEPTSFSTPILYPLEWMSQVAL